MPTESAAGSAPLATFNELPAAAAKEQMIACCSSPPWADAMEAGRPYPSVDDAIARSAQIVARLTDEDLAAALAGHPRIGDRQAQGRSRQEQSGAMAATGATRQALAAANVEYEQRFGHIYLVCASGRTGDELLELCRNRLSNDSSTEWQVVRGELQQINEIRLRKLLGGPA
ncbi:MAG TPA: 2-oxo-4-hydroxy-4-carboxy-5-ureidoimidazoline decarboxylase [Streptosporangiaceae bacterium]|nr:2-oxo-4-hydroxy-4-carboxy-5-ureidoimidazoline decarboxylase [Streptosporangiaceae bacterium]